MRKIFATIITLILLFTVLACNDNKNNEYTLNFQTNGGSEIGSIVIKDGDTSFMDSITSPSKEGYTFDGWYIDESLSQKWDGSVNENLTIYARWTKNEYKLSFETFTGSNPDDIEIKFNDDIPTIENPSRVGYTFGGWYLDEEFENPYTLTKMPAKNVTLYAKWTINQYTVRFFVDNVLKSEVLVDYNNTISVNDIPTIEVKKGYQFMGFQANGESFDLSSPITENVDLHAHFVINKYNLNFIVDGNTTTVEYEYDANISAIKSPEKEGYTFAGWTTYNEELDSYKSFSFMNAKMPDHDINLYSSWTTNNYSISFMLNGGTGVENLYDIPYDSVIQLPLAPTKTGYSFGGWYTDADLENKFELEKMPARNLTLYAKWTPLDYTITFVTNGGSEVKPITKAYESAVTAPDAPSRTGYTFDGWYKDDKFNEKYTFTTMPLNGITLYAKWTANNYTISFVTGDKDVVVAPITQGYETAVTAPNVPSRTGYTFDYWMYEGKEYKFTTMPLGGITLEAKWTINKYTVTFVNYDGTELQSSEVEYGKFPVYEGNTPERPATAEETFTFVGWDKVIVSVKENVTYKATFSSAANSYTVTWKSIDSEGKEYIYYTNSVVNGTVINAPENPTRTGYNFNGWDNLPESMPAYDIVITAKWTLIEYTIKFLNENGNELQSSKVPYGQMPVYNGETPTKAATAEYTYTFNGWDKELSKVTGDITYKATYTATANSYTISWMSIDNTGKEYTYTETVVVNGLNIETPANPTRNGYSFTNWDNVPSKMPAKDITITALWVAHKYTVTFNGNGATSGSTSSLEFTYDVEQALNANNYLRTGYTFDGWNTKPDGSGQSYTGSDDEMVSNLTASNNATVILYAQWTKNEYRVVINMEDCHGYTNVDAIDVMVPYDESLVDYLNANNYQISRIGHTYAIYQNSLDVTDSFEVYKIKDANDVIEFNVKYKPEEYTVSIIIDGKNFYTNKLKFGTVLTYEKIIAEYREKAEILHNLAQIMQAYMPYMMMYQQTGDASYVQAGINAVHPKLLQFNSTLCENFEAKTYGDIINGFSSLSTYYNVFCNVDTSKFGVIQDFIALINNEYLTYLEIGKNDVPLKDGYIFAGWVLGHDTYYINSSTNDPYQGYVPAGSNKTSSIIANFVKAPKIDLTSEDLINTESEKSIDWTSEWSSIVEQDLKFYSGYDMNVSFDIYHYDIEEESLILKDTVTNTKYIFMTESTLNVPGVYEIVVIANVKVVNAKGDVITSFQTDMHSPITVSLVPDYGNATLTGEGAYFYTGTDTNNNKFINLFTNSEYTFSNYLEITNIDGSCVNISYADKNLTVETDSILNTTNFTGSFVIKSYTVYDIEHPENNKYDIVYAYVYPSVTGFAFEDSLANFKFTIENADSSEFLNDKKTDLYKIGVRDTQFTTKVNGVEVSKTDYANNGVKLGVNVYANGSLVDYKVYSEFAEYIVYNFYKYYNGEWVLIEDELDSFRIQKGNVFEFNALPDVEKYKVVASINSELFYIPKAHINYIKPVELEFELNDCVNIYTHEKLQSIFANLNYNKGINIHSNIEVKLSDAEKYSDGIKYGSKKLYDINPAIKLLADMTPEELAITAANSDAKPNYSLYKDNLIPFSSGKTGKNVAFDGSALNMGTWELHHLLTKAYLDYKAQIDKGDYKDYFDFIATFKTGNPYFRGAIVPTTYTEDYKIYGNYFEIDGSNLDYITINSNTNLSGIDGYKIPNSNSSIFSYNVNSNVKNYNNLIANNYQNAWNGTYIKSDAKITFNDLIITSNTTTTHTADKDLTNNAIALMNRNAGGFSAISANYGGSVDVNNSVIIGATLGIAIRYEGELNVDSTYILSSWAHSVYLTDAGDVNVTNSFFKDSGGPALYAEDTESNAAKDASGNKYTTPHVINIDINTRIENYIVGTEGYFNAYGMTAAVITLKGQMEEELRSLDYQSVLTTNNYLGLPDEMINLSFMLCAGGLNNSNNGGSATCFIDLNIVDGAGNIIKTHNASVNIPFTANKHQFVELGSGSINDAYYLLSYPIPGKGISIIGMGADKTTN